MAVLKRLDSYCDRWLYRLHFNNTTARRESDRISPLFQNQYPIRVPD